MFESTIIPCDNSMQRCLFLSLGIAIHNLTPRGGGGHKIELLYTYVLIPEVYEKKAK